MGARRRGGAAERGALSQLGRPPPFLLILFDLRRSSWWWARECEPNRSKRMLRQHTPALSRQVLYALPELDGAVDAVPLGGLVGDQVLLCGERLARLAGRVRSWVELRRTPPARRRLAVILYGFPPGVGATGTAALLNVPRVRPGGKKGVSPRNRLGSFNFNAPLPPPSPPPRGHSSSRWRLFCGGCSARATTWGRRWLARARRSTGRRWWRPCRCASRAR